MDDDDAFRRAARDAAGTLACLAMGGCALAMAGLGLAELATGEGTAPGLAHAGLGLWFAWILLPNLWRSRMRRPFREDGRDAGPFLAACAATFLAVAAVDGPASWAILSLAPGAAWLALTARRRRMALLWA